MYSVVYKTDKFYTKVCTSPFKLANFIKALRNKHIKIISITGEVFE